MVLTDDNNRIIVSMAGVPPANGFSTIIKGATGAFAAAYNLTKGLTTIAASKRRGDFNHLSDGFSLGGGNQV